MAEKKSTKLATAFQKLGVVVLAFLVLNIPLLMYGLVYDRVPHLLTSIFYFGSFLVMAGGATVLCRKLLSREVARSTELIFGLQVMFGFLPGIFIGCYLASPYVKATFLAPSTDFRPGAVYYSFEEVAIRGDLQASKTKTRRTRNGESSNVVTTVYNVAPLMSPDGKVGPLWVVREGKDNRFDPRTLKVAPFQGLATLSSSTLRDVAEKSLERSGSTLTDDAVFLVEFRPEDREWYERYLMISLAVLNLVVLGGTSILLRREKTVVHTGTKEKAL